LTPLPAARRSISTFHPNQQTTGKVEVTTGDAEALQLAMEPNFEVGEFGTPGDYRAFFIPTAPGSYSFHFTGDHQGPEDRPDLQIGASVVLGHGGSGPGAVPVKQPTGGQLATRADRETTRINATLTEERDQAKDDAASARTLAIIGLIVGALGLIAAIVALARSRRPAVPAAASDSESATVQRR
jgi:hypothetical protein